MAHVKHRNSVVGHIARMSHTVPVYQALCSPADLSLGQLPDRSWQHRPGHAHKRWLEQIRDDNCGPPADVWRDGIRRGNSGVTQRSSLTCDNDGSHVRTLLVSGCSCHGGPSSYLLWPP